MTNLSKSLMALSVAMLAGFLWSANSRILAVVLFYLWFSSMSLCIVWGFHISRRNRREGWWCVLLALIEVLVIILRLTKRF
jgi:hypothetical protein